MPYRKDPNNERCVQVQRNGVWEEKKCFETKEEADDHLAALEINVSEAHREFKRPTQAEVNFKSHAPDNMTCATCRFQYEDGMCYIIENTPDDVTAKSVCDRHEPKPGAPAVEPKPESAPEPQPDADQAIYAAPKDTTFLQKISQKVVGGLKPGSTVIRAKDGKRYMFIVTSNSYEDRESETLTTKSLERWVNSCWPADDYFHTSNKQLVWHHDALEVGDIVWADMAGPFLLEVARERPGIIAKTAYDYYESTDEALGASHRFAYPTSQRDDDGTYHVIDKLETSTLPRKAAANLLTFSGVLPMDTARNEHLDKMFGIEGVAELLKKGPDYLEAALEAKGIQHKSEDTPDAMPEPAQKTEQAENNFATLVVKLTEGLADILGEFDSLKTSVDKALADAAETRQQEKAADTARLDALEVENKALREAMNESPRVTLSGPEADKAKAEIDKQQQPVHKTDSVVEGWLKEMERGG